jgi:hypothetical protein
VIGQYYGDHFEAILGLKLRETVVDYELESDDQQAAQGMHLIPDQQQGMEVVLLVKALHAPAQR